MVEMTWKEGDLKGNSNGYAFSDLDRSAQEVPCVTVNANVLLSLLQNLFCFHLFLFYLSVKNNYVRKLWKQYKMKVISEHAANKCLDSFLPIQLLLDSSFLIEFKCELVRIFLLANSRRVMERNLGSCQ